MGRPPKFKTDDDFFNAYIRAHEKGLKKKKDIRKYLKLGRETFRQYENRLKDRIKEALGPTLDLDHIPERGLENVRVTEVRLDTKSRVTEFISNGYELFSEELYRATHTVDGIKKKRLTPKEYKRASQAIRDGLNVADKDFDFRAKFIALMTEGIPPDEVVALVDNIAQNMILRGDMPREVYEKFIEEIALQLATEIEEEEADK